MFKQEPKLLIDIGEIGNASTGDILYEGGKKINSDFQNIYNTFGDQRLNDSITQVLHATGYYQKISNNDWSSPVEMGAMRDVDTSTGIVTATLSKGVKGECIVFVNSNGSFSPLNYLDIVPVDQFVSVTTPTLKITVPYSKITLWCVDDSNGISKWDYSIESMFGNKQTAIDKTFVLNNTPKDIFIGTVGQYQTIKFILTAMSADGKKYKASELLAYIDSVKGTIVSTEYAVLRAGHESEEDEIYKIDFKIVPASSGPDRFIQATASSSTANMRLAIKAVATQTFGVNQ